MKNKSYIIIGILILFTTAVFQNTLLAVGGFALIAFGLFNRLGLSSGVEYNESHYRIYKRILFWKRGHWQSIVRVRKIYIRHYASMQHHYFASLRGVEASHEPVMEYQVYFVRRSGYYKIFESSCLDTARSKAAELGKRYNLIVEEKEKAKQIA